MKNLIKIISILSVIIVIFFFDNIFGYFRFKQLCEKEKNNQIISKLEPNVGWIFNEGRPSSKWDVFEIAVLPNVKFVRFKNYRDKQTYDVRYLGGDMSREKSFELTPADSKNKVIYSLKKINEDFHDELRISRYGSQVIDLRSKNIVVNLTNISYGMFDRNHTLLDAPSGNTCDWYEYLGKDSNKTLIFGK